MNYEKIIKNIDKILNRMYEQIQYAAEGIGTLEGDQIEEIKNKFQLINEAIKARKYFENKLIEKEQKEYDELLCKYYKI